MVATPSPAATADPPAKTTLRTFVLVPANGRRQFLQGLVLRCVALMRCETLNHISVERIVVAANVFFFYSEQCRVRLRLRKSYPKFRAGNTGTPVTGMPSFLCSHVRMFGQKYEGNMNEKATLSEIFYTVVFVVKVNKCTCTCALRTSLLSFLVLSRKENKGNICETRIGETTTYFTLTTTPS